MNFFIQDHEVNLTLICKKNKNYWVGIIISHNIRNIEGVVCFTPVSFFDYFAYGCAPVAYGCCLYKTIINHILNNDILSKL